MEHILSVTAIAIVLGLAFLLLVFQFITGVPPMSSNAAEAADVIALLQQAALPPGAVIYDLGCGWGSLVMALARAFPEARIRGIEMSPVPYWVAWWRTRHLPNISLHRGDFHEFDLHDAQAITCYLMIKPMPRLAALLDNQLKTGTPVVALTFWFRNRQVIAERNAPGLRGAAALYLWPARSPEPKD